VPNAHSLLPRDPEPKPRRVLVTGAAGFIGRYFVEHAPERYELRLMVRPGERLEGREAVEAELGDLACLKEVCQGIDTIVHLAGESSPFAEWTPLLESNVVGTYNLFVAAKAAGCRRVVYASSIHAVSGYPEDVQVGTDAPVSPGDLYGVTKCFGEALARYMAEHEGISSIAVRIGAFQKPEWVRNPERIGNMDAWVSQRDLMQLLVRCIDDESIRFAIVNGLSDNRFNRLDITSARELLGYVPEDRFFRENPGLPNFDEVQRHSVLDGYPSGLRGEL
jgi:dTDP-4-dehydrorhamnose reductase